MVFSYNGSFVGAANLTDATKTNTATVTEYFSWDPSNEGRRYVPGAGGVPAATDTAQVTPVFPNVALLATINNWAFFCGLIIGFVGYLLVRPRTAA